MAVAVHPRSSLRALRVHAPASHALAMRASMDHAACGAPMCAVGTHAAARDPAMGCPRALHALRCLEPLHPRAGAHELTAGQTGTHECIRPTLMVSRLSSRL